MRVICISDTHSRLGRVSVPDGDLLIHAGDLTGVGTPDEVLAEYAALSRLPHRAIIAIPGNHDYAFQFVPHVRKVLAEKFPRVITLIDEEVTIHGMRIWGSPWQPWWQDWAYNFLPGLAGRKEAEEKWNEIPDDTSILITHGPSYGMLDKTDAGKHAGCPALKRRIRQLSHLRLHVFGHIHDAHGIRRVKDLLSVNASICDEYYRPIQRPIALDFKNGRFDQAHL